MAHHLGLCTKYGAALAIFVGLASVAAAHDPAGPGRGPIAPNPGAVDSAWNTGSYLAALKSELGITARQEAAWKDYAGATLSAGTEVQDQQSMISAAMRSASWPERRNMMNQMLQARQPAFDTVHQAASRLVPALDPDQQARARSILPGLA